MGRLKVGEVGECIWARSRNFGVFLGRRRVRGVYVRAHTTTASERGRAKVHARAKTEFDRREEEKKVLRMKLQLGRVKEGGKSFLSLLMQLDILQFLFSFPCCRRPLAAAKRALKQEWLLRAKSCNAFSFLSSLLLFCSGTFFRARFLFSPPHFFPFLSLPRPLPFLHGLYHFFSVLLLLSEPGAFIVETLKEP